MQIWTTKLNWRVPSLLSVLLVLMGSYSIANFWRLHKKDILHYLHSNPLHNNLQKIELMASMVKTAEQKWVSRTFCTQRVEIRVAERSENVDHPAVPKIRSLDFPSFLRSTGDGATDSYQNDDKEPQSQRLVRLPFSRSGWDGVWSKVTKNSFPFTFRRVEIIISKFKTSSLHCTVF